MCWWERADCGEGERKKDVWLRKILQLFRMFFDILF